MRFSNPRLFLPKFPRRDGFYRRKRNIELKSEEEKEARSHLFAKNSPSRRLTTRSRIKVGIVKNLSPHLAIKHNIVVLSLSSSRCFTVERRNDAFRSFTSTGNFANGNDRFEAGTLGRIPEFRTNVLQFASSPALLRCALPLAISMGKHTILRFSFPNSLLKILLVLQNKRNVGVSCVVIREAPSSPSCFIPKGRQVS